jgi:hypothetical protein
MFEVLHLLGEQLKDHGALIFARRDVKQLSVTSDVLFTQEAIKLFHLRSFALVACCTPPAVVTRRPS